MQERRLINGAVTFYPCSVDSRSVDGTTLRRGYRGEVEWFGVYCPANRQVYLVPVDDVPVGARVEVDFQEVGPGQLIHEWRIVPQD